MEDTKIKRWVFTINNYSEEEKELVTQLIEDEEHTHYGIAEEEVGKEGTPHIQGFVHLKYPLRRSTIHRLLGGRAYVEVAKGSLQQNIDYCSKEGKVFVSVIPVNNNSKKGETLAMIQDMKTMTPDEFENNYPIEWYRNRAKVEKVMIDSAMKKMEIWNGELSEKNIWIWGLAGLGKSAWASKQERMERTLKKNCNKWWGGYNLVQTKCVIVEDYPCRPMGNMLVQHMKIWGDRYPFIGETKGSEVWVEPGRFILIVTSNYPIENCFENEEDIQAIKRRFHEIHMTEENKAMILSTKIENPGLKE